MGEEGEFNMNYFPCYGKSGLIPKSVLTCLLLPKTIQSSEFNRLKKLPSIFLSPFTILNFPLFSYILHQFPVESVLPERGSFSQYH